MHYKRDFVISFRETRDFYLRLALRSWTKGFWGFGIVGALVTAVYWEFLTLPGGICVEILARYTFETNLFEKRKTHPLSVAELNELMLDAQRYAYGDGLTGDLHPFMWACKPHYYFPDFHFYNFPYPYGLLFAKGLFALYEKNPVPNFVDMFNRVLYATGASNMDEIFQIIGCPSDSLEFYGNALRLITNQIDAFCRMNLPR